MTRFGEDDGGWAFDVFDPGQEDAALEPFVSLIALWREKSAGRSFPAWSDFDIMDFQAWWGWLYVRDVIAFEPMSLRYRLWGTQVTELYGVDVTGQVIEQDVASETADLLGVADTDYRFFRHVLQNRQIGVMSGQQRWRNRGHVWYSMLCLPLADDGENPDKIFSAVSKPRLVMSA